MRWDRPRWACFLLLGACATDAASVCTTVQLLDDGDLHRWPESRWLLAGSVVYPAGQVPELTRVWGPLEGSLEAELSQLGGFGANAEVYFRLSDPLDADRLPPGAAELWVRTGSAPFEPWPAAVELAEDGCGWRKWKSTVNASGRRTKTCLGATPERHSGWIFLLLGGAGRRASTRTRSMTRPALAVRALSAPASVFDGPVDEYNVGVGLGSSGDYLHLDTVASGGMGQVSLAVRREGRFQRLFAVKRLRPELSKDEEAKSSFLEEARVAGLLRHRAVVPVLDCGVDDDGPYLVMDFVRGMSLSKLLKVMARRQRSIPVQVAVRILRDLADGLHAAHELRSDEGKPLELIHRDVSPQNVLIGFDGGARLTDFGIARALGRVDETKSGILKGKLAYMAPEQLQFLPLDRRSDLFALGVVAFEVVSSRRLFRGDTFHEVARSILSGPRPSLRSLVPCPVDLDRLVAELLDVDPERRPKTARRVRDRLDAIIAELASTEGTKSVEEFLEREAGEERERVNAWIARLLEGAESPAPKVEVESLGPNAEKGSRPRPWVRLVLPAIIAALVALGTVWGWTLVSAAPAESPAAAPANPSAFGAEAAGRPPVPDEPAVVEVTPIPSDQDARADAPEAIAAMTTKATPMTRPSMQRVRSMRTPSVLDQLQRPREFQQGPSSR
ncbi:MAG: serine/threonine-protein kinase [Myxococcota bacterium]